MKFTSECIETVGQLRELINEFPDDKPIIIDEEGNTRPPVFYNWANAKSEDCEWPIGIR